MISIVRTISSKEGTKIPAWTSTSIQLKEPVTGFNKFAFVRTSKAIYDRVFLTSAFSANFVGLRFKAWDSKSRRLKETSELLNRNEIKEIRYYER